MHRTVLALSSHFIEPSESGQALNLELDSIVEALQEVGILFLDLSLFLNSTVGFGRYPAGRFMKYQFLPGVVFQVHPFVTLLLAALIWFFNCALHCVLRKNQTRSFNTFGASLLHC